MRDESHLTLSNPSIEMHGIRGILWKAFCLFIFAFSAAAQTNGPLIHFGEPFTFHSKILNQDRPYWVALPASYHAKGNRQRYPASAYAYKHLADVYLATGKKELAIENYKKALVLDPNTDGVKKALKELRP